MEESLKNRVIIILALLSAILLIGNISSCSLAHNSKAARDKEMLSRLDLEEKMNKASQEKVALEDKLAKANQELEEEKVSHTADKKALTQEKMVVQSLKEELQKINKLKEALEEDLKEALAANKSTKRKK